MNKEYWFAIFAGLLYGLITVGGQFFINLGLSIYEIALFRVLFTGLILLPIVLIRRKYLIKKEMIPFFIIFGLIGALVELSTFLGIVLGISVAIVALLLYTQPIWTTLLGKLMLNEKITKIKIVSVCIAFAGIIILIKPWDISSIGSITGIVSALLSGIFLSLWVIYSRKSGIIKQHPLTTTFGWGIFSALWLLLSNPIISLFIHEQNIISLTAGLSATVLFSLIIFGIISGTIPSLFFYKSVQKLQASTAGVILLLEPVSAALLAAVFFAQPLGLNILLGGALILFSNYLVIRE